MESKAKNPVGLLAGKRLHPLVEAYFELCQLKQLYRQGWLRRGVPKERCESVAEHSFGVAVLALWLVDAYYPELDAGKVLRMALLHDIGEIYAGDLIPSDSVSPQEKHQREEQSVDKVLAKLPAGDVYRAVWGEFEAGDSPEARLVRQVDRLEMGFQAGVYASQGLARLGEFSASARRELSDSVLIELMEAVDSLAQGKA